MAKVICSHCHKQVDAVVCLDCSIEGIAQYRVSTYNAEKELAAVEMKLNTALKRVKELEAEVLKLSNKKRGKQNDL